MPPHGQLCSRGSAPACVLLAWLAWLVQGEVQQLTTTAFLSRAYIERNITVVSASDYVRLRPASLFAPQRGATLPPRFAVVGRTAPSTNGTYLGPPVLDFGPFLETGFAFQLPPGECTPLRNTQSGITIVDSTLHPCTYFTSCERVLCLSAQVVW